MVSTIMGYLVRAVLGALRVLTLIVLKLALLIGLVIGAFWLAESAGVWDSDFPWVKILLVYLAAVMLFGSVKPMTNTERGGAQRMHDLQQQARRQGRL